MADGTVLDRTENLAPDVAADAVYVIKNYAGVAVDRYFFNAVLLGQLGFSPGGRISASTGPFTSGSVTGSTTIYYVPYDHDSVPIYDPVSGHWLILPFVSASLSIPSSTNQVYDVFGYNNGGTLALEAVAWASDTARATSLASQDGLRLKSGDLSRIALGSFRTTEVSGQTEDSVSRRLVSNMYNRREKSFYFADSTQHVYGTSAWRAWNDNTTIGQTRADFVNAIEQVIDMKIRGYSISGAAGSHASNGVLLNGTNSANAIVRHPYNQYRMSETDLQIFADLGYNYIQATQYGSSSSTFYSTLFTGALLT